MDCREMKLVCPSARFVTRACLRDHRLDFTRYSKTRRCGVADILAERGNEVWGVVYEIDEADLPSLHRKEGYYRDRSDDSAYRQMRVVVLADGDERKSLPAIAYEVVSKCHECIKPSREYKNILVDAARFWELPESHVRWLEGIPARGEGENPIQE
jgi:gamma-glutamylcyclotransferase (GGCT)/AIG2-like uncharacterized protein YtfP